MSLLILFITRRLLDKLLHDGIIRDKLTLATSIIQLYTIFTIDIIAGLLIAKSNVIYPLRCLSGLVGLIVLH